MIIEKMMDMKGILKKSNTYITSIPEEQKKTNGIESISPPQKRKLSLNKKNLN